MKNEKNIIIDQFFEDCWTLYPRKEGKAKVKPARKKELYKLGDELKRAITRYTEEVKGREKQYVKQGSTFFCGDYTDYLDANYQEPKEKQEEQTRGWKY